MESPPPTSAHSQVLFRPNTVFSITSTLYGTSDIGQFYSGIDNIAMQESAIDCDLSAPDSPSGSLARTLSRRRRSTMPGAPPASHVVVTLPHPLCFPAINSIANMEEAVIEDMAIETQPDGGSLAQVAVRAVAARVMCVQAAACSGGWAGGIGALVLCYCLSRLSALDDGHIYWEWGCGGCGGAEQPRGNSTGLLPSGSTPPPPTHTHTHTHMLAAPCTYGDPEPVWAAPLQGRTQN